MKGLLVIFVKIVMIIIFHHVLVKFFNQYTNRPHALSL